MSNDEKLNTIRNAVLALSVPETTEATQSALDAGVDPYQIIKEGLAAGLTEVGDKWLKKEMFISHVLVAAKAVTAAQEMVEKTLVGKEGQYKASIVLGTPKGDLHDIGKNLVAMMMRAAGFKVYDLGVDVEPQAFIDKAKEVDADLIGMSLIMSICLDQMQKVCRMVKQNGVRAKTIIGGPATSEKVANQIGADAYGGFDAVTGVNIAKGMLDIT
jgi:5-methyltetrahydrofolate--homocysteine methyltransferase